MMNNLIDNLKPVSMKDCELWLDNLWGETAPKYYCYSSTCPASFETIEERAEHESKTHER